MSAKIAQSIGHMPEFDENVEDWVSYEERLGQYIFVNDIPKEKQVATLLTLVGAKTYKLLKNLVAPEIPSKLAYEQLTASLKTHYSPKKLVIRERFIFNKRNQGPNESINDYLAALKQLASTCDFGDHLDDQLRDRLVCGLRNDSIRKRLLAEDKITLQKATDLCLSMESASLASSELGRHDTPTFASSRVDAMQTRFPAPRQWQRTPFLRCNRCGGPHEDDICRYKEAVCRKCEQKGHLQRCCVNKSKPIKPDKFQSHSKGEKKFRKRFTGRGRGRTLYKAHDVDMDLEQGVDSEDCEYDDSVHEYQADSDDPIYHPSKEFDIKLISCGYHN